MKILVYGAGAIGSAIGERLSFKHDVVLLCRRPHADAIRLNGLCVRDKEDRVAYLRCITSLNEIGEVPDVVIITTKAYDTKNACEDISQISGSETIVASIQNGLSNYDYVNRKFGRRGIVGVTSMGVTMIHPGEVIIAGDGPISFGPCGYAAETVSKVFTQCGLDAKVSSHIFLDIWTKAVINASINPVTVIAGRQNNCVMHDPYRLISKEACMEAAEVAKVEGINIKDPWEQVLEVAERTATNKSSMLQDIEKGKKTEVREITGEIVRRAKGFGIPVPVNGSLLELLKSIEKGGKSL